MKRISILAASVLALIGTIGMPMTAQAAPCGQNQIKVIVAGSNNNCNTQDIKNQLSRYGINLDEVIKNNTNNMSQNSNNNGCVTAAPAATPTPAPQAPATEAKPVPETKPVQETNTGAKETPAANTTPDNEVKESLTYQEQVVKLVNEERAKAGLSALTLDASVQSAAQVRAQESATSFSHTRPNGSSFSTALTEAGVQYRGSGENIAWGQKTPEEVVEGWMNSAGHRANILNASYTKIGVGYYQNAKGVNYWSQLFTY